MSKLMGADYRKVSPVASSSQKLLGAGAEHISEFAGKAMAKKGLRGSKPYTATELKQGHRKLCEESPKKSGNPKDNKIPKPSHK